MRTPILLRSIAACILIIWLPSTASAARPIMLLNETFSASFQERKQEPKKPVKEVPQSRKQDKPREVKPGKS